MTTARHWRDRLVCLATGHRTRRIASPRIRRRFVVCTRCGGTASYAMERADTPWGRPRGRWNKMTAPGA